MNTEITDTMNARRHHWVCYDAECGLCVRWAERFRGLLERHGFLLLPLQSAEVRETLRMPEEELLAEMRVITTNGRVFGGADALVYLSNEVYKPLFWLAHVPGVKPMLRSGYRIIARNRTCSAVGCKNPVGKRTGETPVPLKTADWLPLVLLPPTAAVIGTKFPAWIYMWLLAFALFIGCKWLCFRRELAKGTAASRARKIGFLFGWVGMDAAKFLSSGNTPAKPRASEWIFAAVKILAGAILLWVGARLALRIDPLLAGWTGMVGIILLLHFGFFDLLALAWRRAGVPATLLMRAPLLSRSVGEFWGNRWNTAFHELTTTFLFRPLRGVADMRAAILLVFLASGLIHDLVISVPARGGYGLPTLYFLLQGAAVLFEHTKIARRGRDAALRRPRPRPADGTEFSNAVTRTIAPLNAAGTAQRAVPAKGIRGWLFMFLVTAGPAFWLFPPPFVHHVILPMLHAIGAT